jgi:hypothetical protein
MVQPRQAGQGARWASDQSRQPAAAFFALAFLSAEDHQGMSFCHKTSNEQRQKSKED